MLFFIVAFLLQFSAANAISPSHINHAVSPKEVNLTPPVIDDNKHAELPNIATKPVNNGPIMQPFPVENQDETVWSKKLEEYIYSYQIRYGNIGDKFILPEDMEEFLKTLPHGTTDKPIASLEEQNKIATVFDENYQQSIVDQYFRMQYRILAPTMR